EQHVDLNHALRGGFAADAARSDAFSIKPGAREIGDVEFYLNARQFATNGGAFELWKLDCELLDAPARAGHKLAFLVDLHRVDHIAAAELQRPCAGARQ